MSAPRLITGLDELRTLVGEHLSYSDYLEITQERVDKFAQATGDFQWIHVDVERATAGPFGGPIAHGYLTLSLSNLFLPQIVEVQGFSAGVNYGPGKVRFPAPVPVGSRVRGSAELVEVSDVPGGLQTLIRITIERSLDGETVDAKPACIIDSLPRGLFD